MRGAHPFLKQTCYAFPEDILERAVIQGNLEPRGKKVQGTEREGHTDKSQYCWMASESDQS